MSEEIKKVNNNEVDDVENTKKVRKCKKRIVIPIIIGFIVGVILLFVCTSYKLLFSPKKIRFLSCLASDMSMVESVLENITDNQLVDFITDGETKKLDMSVNLDAKELMNSTIINKDFLALKFNDINEKYLLIENKGLDKLFATLGMNSEELPKKINAKDFSIMLTNGEKRKIFNYLTYCASKIINNLDSDDFILTNERTLDINGETRKLKAIEVVLSETDLFMLQKEVMTALNDKGIVDLAVKKVNKITNSQTLNKKEIKAELEKYIAYLDYAKSYYDLQGQQNEYYIVYRIYCDSSNKVVAREIIEKYTYEGILYEDIIARVVTDENGFYEVRVFSQEDYSNAYYNIVSDTITTDNNIENHNITYKIEGFYIEDSEEEENYIPINLSANYNLILETDENGVNKIKFNDENNMYSFNLEYDSTMADASFIISENNLNVEVKIENKDETKKSLADDSVVLNNMTREELVQIIGTTGNKIMEIFAE